MLRNENMLSEMNYIQKDKFCMLLLHIYVCDIINIISRIINFIEVQSSHEFDRDWRKGA